jgi:hypothetical protein
MLVSKAKAGLFAAATLSAVLPAGSAAGATLMTGSGSEATVPFAFHVGSTYLPAGKYSFEQRKKFGAPLFVRNDETGKGFFLMCGAGSDQCPSKLTFGKDETGYVLTKIR